MKDEANEMIRSEQEKVNISQDNLGKWRWASPTTKFLQVADSRVRAKLWTMRGDFWPSNVGKSSMRTMSGEKV
jgi:hypothetical protein